MAWLRDKMTARCWRVCTFHLQARCAFERFGLRGELNAACFAHATVTVRVANREMRYPYHDKTRTPFLSSMFFFGRGWPPSSIMQPKAEEGTHNNGERRFVTESSS
jgi:hypothetical protein